jgi:hypothetical protein
MKKISKSKGGMLPDYDFSRGVRGKYAKNSAKGSNFGVKINSMDITALCLSR